MLTDYANIAPAGYLTCAVVFAAFAIILAVAARRNIDFYLLGMSSAVTAVWAAAMAWGSTTTALSTADVLMLEVARDVAWLVALYLMMRGAIKKPGAGLVRSGPLAAASLVLFVAVLVRLMGGFGALPASVSQLIVLGPIASSLCGLVALEQVFRNSRQLLRGSLKYFCLGAAFVFVYNLLLYSNAAISGEVSKLLWDARGYVLVLGIPLIALGAYRSSQISVGMFVSRQVVFYSAALVGAGVYLVVVALLGYYVRIFGGNWGSAAQVFLTSAALLFLVVLLFSNEIRARGRVLIVKHFFRNKYDYRLEWLRLTDTLSQSADETPLLKRAIRAVAEILGSSSGQLWRHDESTGEYVCIASWNTSLSRTCLSPSSPLAEFLAEKEWIIERSDVSERPENYVPLSADWDFDGMPDAEIIVPLLHDDKSYGFLLLASPEAPLQMNFEDRDLLRCAGRQIASHLMQAHADELLTEGRQFDAYHRLTTFLMHDLKNLIAQQILLVSNAERHKHEPEFIDDAVLTIQGSVARMQKILNQLAQGVPTLRPGTTDVQRVVLKAASACADRQPYPVASDIQPASVHVDPERFESALVHLIRNAQDASDPDSRIIVWTANDTDGVSVYVKDTGQGMDREFINERLFKPFDSTKGSRGLGIGVYQVREFAIQSGGALNYQSDVGVGTTVRLLLPAAGKS
jgi:putative PEP-CTERM system histidine kinase